MMTSDDQPTQPLTDAELSALRDYIERTNHVDNLRGDARRLLAEVDRLRTESVRHVDCNAEAWAAAARVTRDLRAELDSMTQFAESLRAERDRSVRSCGELGVELDRLRAENEQMRLEVVQMESGSQIAMNAGVAALQEVGRLEIVCDDLKLINERMAEDRLQLVDERDRLIAERETDADVIRQLRAEATGTALGHLAKIERLQSQRDALVRKLGLDWGPDEFGDLSGVPDPSSGDVSDGYHTHNELYEYRMLYNAHAARGWLASGHRVVKSWRHSDGELCFGGGWFVVVAELPTGQVTNHYEAEHWELFEVPEKLPTAYDGHSPAEAAHRLRQALGFE